MKHILFGSEAESTQHSAPSDLEPNDFKEIQLIDGDRSELEIRERHFLDEARELVARSVPRGKIIDVLRTEFLRERGSLSEWTSVYYPLASSAAATATREAEEATGIKAALEPPTAISSDELFAARATPECFVEELLFADIRLVAAAGATGKTTLMLLELAALAGGAETLYGRNVLRHGPVVYISGEDSREVLVARLREVINDNGMVGKTATILRNFFIADVSGTRSRLTAIVNDTVVTSDGVDQLVHWLRAIKPIAVVIDPLASFSVGEGRTNDAEQGMIEAGRHIRNSVGCCVTLVHHVGKQNARDGAADQYAFRGGSALADGARMVTILGKIDNAQWLKATGTELAECDDGIRLAVAKSTYVRKPEDIFIRRNGYRFGLVARLPKPIPLSDDAQDAEVLNFIRAAFTRATASGQQRDYPSQNRVLDASELKGMSRTALKQSLSRLSSAGKVERRPIPNRFGRGGAREYLHPVDAYATAPPAHQCEPMRLGAVAIDAPDIGDPFSERIGSAAIAAAAPSGRRCADQQSITNGASNHQSWTGGAA